MEYPDKSEPGNENKYNDINSAVGHEYPDSTEQAKAIAERETDDEDDQPIRNSDIRAGESQGGVSDSLKGGDRK